MRSRADVISILERELRDAVTANEWDEFQSFAIADPELDSIRQAVPLEGRHTPEGRAKIEQCIAQLRERAV